MKRDFNNESLQVHKCLNGKIRIKTKTDINLQNLPVLYTPGISGPCLKVWEEPFSAFDLTWKWNSVAIISDGSRLLGLGNRGPLASLPLLEGKSILFSFYGGVDAVPIPISSLPVNETVDLVKAISHGFGGINLEDISTPRCFDILDRLRTELDIPVFHDDQQGTAIIIVAGLINAVKLVNKELKNIRIVLIGAGAANTAVYRLLRFAGLDAKQFMVFDKNGVLGKHRDTLMDVEILRNICNETDNKDISLQNAFRGADAVIALSQPGPDVIKQDWIRSMNKHAIVFACANPIPEIEPAMAKAAGAEIVATGRSDYSNQLNNSLVFPGIFRGALDTRAKTISWGMSLEVSYAIARLAEKKGLSTEYIVPSIDDEDLPFRVAMAAATTAIGENIARVSVGTDEICDIISKNLRQ